MPQKSPLISVIVPVFQVAEYLDQCITSIVSQSYRNLEIILVDDGSTDECPAICDAWEARDTRIKVLHQANEGLSCARNAGLKLATGELIGFVDSDDWLESQMYEKLAQALLETGADLATCRFQREKDGTPTSPLQGNTSDTKIVIPPEEALKTLLLWDNNKIANCVWNKLYCRKLIEDIEFIEKQLYEDVPWTAQVIGRANSCVCLDTVLCHYRQREGSLSHGEKKNIFYKQEIFKVLEYRIQYIKKHYPQLLDLSVSQYQIFCCSKYLELKTKFPEFDNGDIIGRRIYQRVRQWSWMNILKAQKSFVAKSSTIVFYFCPCIFNMLCFIYNRLLRYNTKVTL